jgi:hypothetical protein
MKKSVILTLGLALLPWVATMAQTDDDLYYVPKKSTKSTTTTTTTTPTVRPAAATSSSAYTIAPATVVVRDRKGNTRDVDEYNRRYTSSQNDFSVENDTLYIDERIDSDLNGEWVNGFDGSQDDYEYAVRLIRFRNPRYAIPVSSPLYWDIVYGAAYNTWDWNVYDDGLYAYIFPTFSNRLWWDWRYSPASWYGWYGGWYGGWGWNSWRLSWGWDPWFYGGWSHPHFVHNHFGGFNPGVHAPSFAARPGGGHGIGSVRPSGNRGFSADRNFGGARPGSGIIGQGRSSRFTGTRVEGTGSASGRPGFSFGGSNSVRPSSQGTGTHVNGSTSGSNGRPTSSFVRPNSDRSNGNNYSRPSSTRSSSSSRGESGNSYRPSNSGSNSSFGGGHSSSSFGGGNSGGGRSGGHSGGSRR